MKAEILDGKALATSVLEKLSTQVDNINEALGRPPSLATVLVGDDPESKRYLRSKKKKAEKYGLKVHEVHLPASVSDSELQEQLQQLSMRNDLDGVLLQLPLSQGLDEFAAILSIDPKLDVDGLHPCNQGMLMRAEVGEHMAFVPCTPRGCVALVDHALESLGRSKDLSGLQATVVGRSSLVGKPLADLFTKRNATVTICHSRTSDLELKCSGADILIVAVGKAKLIGKSHVKPGAIVIDVGINCDSKGKLIGDVDFEEVCAVAGALSPVPGGVGPMTIAMLIVNTVESATRKVGDSEAGR